MIALDHPVTEKLERVDGAARVVCARRAGATRIADLYQLAPCRVLFPEVDRDEAFCAALLTTSGGLTGGDRIDVHVEVQDGAAACITTQAAEKIYRSGDGDCSIATHVTVGEGAWAEWLMQETILFDGARLRRQLQADVGATGRLLAVESLVFGRSAMGESFERGFLHESWRIRRGGRLAWVDTMRLDGDVGAQRRQPFGLGDAAGCATLAYVGADAAKWIGVAREAIAGGGAEGGATCLDGVLLVRLKAGCASVLRRATAACVMRLRSEIAGLPARMPRLWSI